MDEFIFNDVLKSGININENEFFSELLKRKPFFFNYEINKDMKFFMCSCGYSEKNSYSKCPKCGNENAFELYELDTEETFYRDVLIEEREKEFQIIFKEYSVKFDLSSLEIELAMETELILSKDGTKVSCEHPYELGDTSDYINSGKDVLLNFIQSNYPSIYEVIEAQEFEFREILLYLYLAFNTPALRVPEIVNNKLISKALDQTLRWWYSYDNLKNFKGLDLEKTDICEVLKIKPFLLSVSEKFDIEKNLCSLQEFSINIEGIESYVERFLESRKLEAYEIGNLIDEFQKIDENKGVSFQTFLMFILSCCYNENIPLYSALENHRYVVSNDLENSSLIDYNKPFKSVYFTKVKAMDTLDKKGLLSKENYKRMLEKPTLETFVRILK